MRVISGQWTVISIFAGCAENMFFYECDGRWFFPSGGAFICQNQFQLGGNLFHQAAPGELGEFFEFCGFHIRQDLLNHGWTQMNTDNN